MGTALLLAGGYAVVVVVLLAVFGSGGDADEDRAVALSALGGDDDVQGGPDVSVLPGVRLDVEGVDGRSPLRPISLDCTRGEAEYRRQRAAFVRGLERRAEAENRGAVTTADAERVLELRADLTKEA